METIECIKTRRSIRKFVDKAVSTQDLLNIMEATKYAPSWKNSQTAQYIAITNEDVKKKVADECVMDFKGNQDIINSAPVLIVQTTVNGLSGYQNDGSFTTSKGTHWQSFDAGISAQTFCLTAHEYGLGTVIMGIFDESKVSEVLSLSGDVSISSLIALGYPAVSPSTPNRKEVSETFTMIES